MWILSGIINSFLIAFPALFSIVNPVGGALIYSQVTADRAHAERVMLAWRVAGYSTGVMLVSLWAGAALIGFFGVTLSALRVAGGLVVAVRAWELLVVALLGKTGSRLVTRITAFLLLCIGMQILLTGVQEALGPLLAPRS